MLAGAEVRCSYFELEGEIAHDLLGPRSHKGLSVRAEDAESSHELVLDGLSRVTAHSARQLSGLVHLAASARAPHGHTVLRIELHLPGGIVRGAGRGYRASRHGTLQLVDLRGATEGEGDKQRDDPHGRSLGALSRCLHELAQPDRRRISADLPPISRQSPPISADLPPAPLLVSPRAPT